MRSARSLELAGESRAARSEAVFLLPPPCRLSAETKQDKPYPNQTYYGLTTLKNWLTPF
ncbi:unnamed protein product, partial [Gulo gulo]